MVNGFIIRMKKLLKLGTEMIEYKTHIIGQKGYELSNHLVNVLTVITDSPIPVDANGYVGYLEAEIISISK